MDTVRSLVTLDVQVYANLPLMDLRTQILEGPPEDVPIVGQCVNQTVPLIQPNLRFNQRIALEAVAQSVPIHVLGHVVLHVETDVEAVEALALQTVPAVVDECAQIIVVRHAVKIAQPHVWEHVRPALVVPDAVVLVLMDVPVDVQMNVKADAVKGLVQMDVIQDAQHVPLDVMVAAAHALDVPTVVKDVLRVAKNVQRHVLESVAVHV